MFRVLQVVFPLVFVHQLAKLYMTAEKYDIKKAVELFEAVADKNM